MKEGRKRKKSKIVLNAVEHPELPIYDPFSELNPLEEVAIGQTETPNLLSREINKFPIELENIAYGVDLWPEIKKHLTVREFQAFELKYKYQMPHYDIAKIMNTKDPNITRYLNSAVQKLRKGMGGKK